MKTVNILKTAFMLGVFAFATPCFADATQDLLKAVKDHNVEGMKTAIAAGADVNGLDANGDTPLRCSIWWPEEVKLLIDAKANVNLRFPLHAAATWGETESVKLLLKAGADVHALNGLNQSALWWAAFNGNQASTLNVLLDAGAKVDGNESGMTPLFVLLRNGKTPAERVATIKSQSPYLVKAGLTLPPRLLEPKESDYSNVGEMVKILIDHHADINAKIEKTNQTALMQAAELGRNDAVQALIDAKADMEAKSITGWTALAYAADNIKSSDAAIALVKAGANVNITFHVTTLEVKALKRAYVAKNDKSKDAVKNGLFNVTPLMLACKEGNMELVKALIAAHADVNVVCSNVAVQATKKMTGYVEQTAATIAHDFAHDELVPLLMAAGAKPIDSINKN